MKKETLIEIILGTIGGLIFAISMCMVLIPEYNMLKYGIFIGIIGLVILLSIIPIYRKYHPKKKKDRVNAAIVVTWIAGVAGALIMGFGMSKVMVENSNSTDMVVGIITGIAGLIVCVLNYPIYAYIKENKKSSWYKTDLIRLSDKLKLSFDEYNICN